MKMPRPRTLALCLSLLSIAPTVLAQTQPSPAAVSEARERFQRGVALSEERNYNAAMVEFQRAYELTRNPVVLFNISATHELTGHFVEALDAMLDYERLAPRENVAQRRAEIDATLARLRGRIGTIVVRFEADGLSLRVDNLQRSVSEARSGLRVPAGRHRISLSAPHFTAREEEVDVAGGSTLVLSEPLVPEAAFMAVDCNVSGAEVLIDGRVVATTPTTSPLPVPEGSHHVMVRRAGFTVYETDVNTVGAGARVRAQLAWASPIPRDVAARVVVQASEPDSVAFLNDHRIALDGSDLVPPGRHTLRVENAPNFLPAERDVDLATGHSNTVSVQLQPTPAYVASYAAMRRRAIVSGAVVTSVGLLVAGAGVASYFLYFNPAYEEAEGRYNGVRGLRLRTTPPATEAEALSYDCEIGGSGVAPALEACEKNRDRDRNVANGLRWGALGVASAGLITAVIGVVMLANVPSGSRFEPHARGSNFRLIGGLRNVGFELSF
jgi:tetratricopeptide (TPR) repeat protein